MRFFVKLLVLLLLWSSVRSVEQISCCSSLRGATIFYSRNSLNLGFAQVVEKFQWKTLCDILKAVQILEKRKRTNFT